MMFLKKIEMEFTKLVTLVPGEEDSEVSSSQKHLLH